MDTSSGWLHYLAVWLSHCLTHTSQPAIWPIGTFVADVSSIAHAGVLAA